MENKDEHGYRNHVREIKSYVALAGKTIYGIERELGFNRGKFMGPLNRGRLRYELVLRIMEKCGFELKWVKKK